MATKTSNIFVWIILGLVMIGLLSFGTANFGSMGRSIGRVGDTSISADAYFREMNAELQAFQQSYGANITMAEAQSIGLDQQVLERVISATAFEDESDRIGLSVGDDALAQRIREIPAFAGPGGDFDRDTYDLALQQSGMTTRDFEASLRSEVARTLLQSSVAAGVSPNPTYTDTLFDWARETRDLSWITLTEADLETPLAAPDEAAVSAFYEDNPEAFTAPETKMITYAWAAPEDVIDEVAIGDEELRALYEERIDEYEIPERRLVERLIFDSTEEAQAAADAIAAGDETFESVVAARGFDLADVDLGDVTRDDLSASAAEAVFALDAPGVAGPADSAFGPALYRMNAVLAEQITTFEEAREELQAEYSADSARRLLDSRITEMEDLLAGGATVEELAETYDMRTGQIGWYPGMTEGIAAYQGFRAAAQAVTTDDYPEMAMLDDGGLFAIRLDEVIAPTLQPLDEVRPAAETGARAAALIAALEARAEELTAALEAGESPEGLGLTLDSETELTREAFLEDTPPTLVERAFGASEGSWFTLSGAQSVVMARVDAITAPDPETEEAQGVIGAYNDRLSQEIGIDLQSAFAAALEAEAGISLDREMINAIHANFP